MSTFGQVITPEAPSFQNSHTAETSPHSGTELLADYEAETRQLDSIRAVDMAGEESSEPSPEPSPEISLSLSKLNLDNLHVALRQLVEGLHGLHETGKLHRDIKPSNVLVTRESRRNFGFRFGSEVEGQGAHDSITLAAHPNMSP